MDPNYPTPGQYPGAPTQTPEHNPYGFIMDTQHQVPRGPLQPNHSSMLTRVLVIGGLALALIIGIIVFMAILSGGKENSAQLLTKLAIEQQEIIRVADLGVKGSSDPATRAYAETTELAVTTQQNNLIDYLNTKKIKIEPAILNSSKNAKIDTALDDAKASNRFDEVFTDTMKTSLTTYATHIKASYEIATNPKSKTLLSEDYSGVSRLLK